MTDTALNLIRLGRVDQAFEMLQRAVTRVRTAADWHLIRKTLELESFHKTQPGWACLYAESLTGTRDFRALLEFTGGLIPKFDAVSAARLRLMRAWGLLDCGRAFEALNELRTAIVHLEGRELGQAYRRLGYALNELGEPSENAFESAEALLGGRELGLCLIDRADCQRRDGHLESARETLTRALAHLEKDVLYLAWAHYNLGEWWLETNTAQAKHHFFEAERLTHRSEARAFRSRGLHALGSLYRLDGDWVRAEHAYLEAFKRACEPDDQCAAAWSAARMQRLQGRYADALEWLEKALYVQPSPRGAIHAERAAVRLAIGHMDSARTALDQTGYLTGRHAQLREIVAAELDRLGGDVDNALNRLARLDPGSVIVREESECFSELFTFARLSQLAFPDRTQPSRRQIYVRACGALSVTIDNHPVRLDAVGRVAELLVLLLEHGQHAHAETLVDRLYPTETQANRKFGALWDLARRLRLTLGWPQSVQISRGLYQLDPHADWHYDAAQARAERRSQTQFLVGINSEWVLETRLELAALEDTI